MPPDAALEAYYDALPEDRQGPMRALRKLIQKQLPKGFVEQLGYGLPAWVVPHKTYPAGYHCDPKLPLPFLSIASQKNFIAVYHMGLYSDPKLLAWFEAEYARRAGVDGLGKLDMGKSCVRFKRPEKIPFELLGELCSRMSPAEWIALYEREVKR
jgi:hypothetical protein